MITGRTVLPPQKMVIVGLENRDRQVVHRLH